jgi:hypothetical protein
MIKANAGIDTSVEKGISIYIGGSPTANYGYESYTYSWTPSEGLSDPTSSNPQATVQSSIVYFVVVSDAMGCTSMDSIVVTMKDATDILYQWDDNNIKVIPNPNQGRFNIQIENTNLEGVDIIIRDASGKMVYKRFTRIKEGKNSIPLNISSLSKGIYIIEIYHECLQYKQKLIIY